MPIDQTLAQEVFSTFTAAGKPIADVEHLRVFWSEDLARKKLDEVRRYSKPARGAKQQQKATKPADPSRLSAMEFRTFIEQMPKDALGGIPKYQVTAVGLVMSNHCDYATGTRMRLTAKALSDMSGVGHRGVVRVLELLVSVGAIAKVRGVAHIAGRPSTEYKFTRSALVESVLKEQVVHEQLAPSDEATSPESIVVHGQSASSDEATSPESIVVPEQSIVVPGQSIVVHEHIIRTQDLSSSVANAPSLSSSLQEEEEKEQEEVLMDPLELVGSLPVDPSVDLELAPEPEAPRALPRPLEESTEEDYAYLLRGL